MKFIDSHTHLLERYYQKIDQNLFTDLEYFVNIGLDRDSLEEFKKILDTNKFADKMFFAVGIHPQNSDEYDNIIEEKLIDLLNYDRVIAIGEIGLDYHYLGYDVNLQKEIFIKQLELARKYKYPVIIHARESLDDIYLILQKYPDLKFLLHSWNQNWENTEKFSKLKNVYFGFNGIITFKNAKYLIETLQNLKLEKILFETDAPYLTPMPFRGKKNYPEYVKFVYQYYAKVLNIEITKLKHSVFQNFQEFFNITKNDK